MKISILDGEISHLGIRDFDPLRIGIGIQLGRYFQPLACLGGSDQLNDHFVADQGFATPVLRNMTEHAVLYFVPFARSRREVADHHSQSFTVSPLLETFFPQAIA